MTINGNFSRQLPRVLVVVSATLVVVGLLLPSLRFEASDRAGKFVSLLRGLPTHRDFTLLGGIVELARSNPLISILLFVFTVVFPMFKLVVLYAWAAETASSKGVSKNEKLPSRWGALSESLGKWSMLDIFVIAIIVVTFKSVGMKVTLGVGVYAFCAAIGLSLVIPALIRMTSRD